MSSKTPVTYYVRKYSISPLRISVPLSHCFLTDVFRYYNYGQVKIDPITIQEETVVVLTPKPSTYTAIIGFPILYCHIVGSTFILNDCLL